MAMAGEYAVILDLMDRGFKSSLSPIEHSPYDILVDTDIGLQRLQVKTTRNPKAHLKGRGRERSMKYNFSMKQDYDNLVDIFAFVALDIGFIHYYAAEAVPCSGGSTGKKHIGATQFADRAEASFENMIETIGIKPSKRLEPAL